MTRDFTGHIRVPPGAIVCKDCGKPLGECSHTSGDLPPGFEVRLAGLDIPLYVDASGVLFEMSEVQAEPMHVPAPGVLMTGEWKGFEYD